MKKSAKKMTKMGFEKIRLAKSYNNVRVHDIIGGKEHTYRSKGEHKIAQILQLLKGGGHIKDWAYEQTKFSFPDDDNPVRTWLVDFDVLENDGRFYYIEYKGLVEPDTKRKLKLLHQYRPEVRVDMICADKRGVKKLGARATSHCRRVLTLREFTNNLF